jgi:hypothetical protein
MLDVATFLSTQESKEAPALATNDSTTTTMVNMNSNNSLATNNSNGSVVNGGNVTAISPRNSEASFDKVCY